MFNWNLNVFSVYVNFLIYVNTMVNTSWNILVLNSVLYSVYRWIYFSLFYPKGTKSAMANPCLDEVIIDNTLTSVDLSAEAVASASTSGLNSISTSHLAGHSSGFPYMDFSNFSPTCGSFI